MSLSRGTAFDPQTLVQAAEDPLYGIVSAFEADQSKHKVDLGVGAYRDDEAQPWILPSVRKAKNILENDPSQNHEYLPIAGLPSFTLAAQKLILGSDSPAITDSRVCSFQAISGTGAVHLGGALLAKFLPRPLPTIYVSTPSWPIHDGAFAHVGLPVRNFSYYNYEARDLDWDGMVAVLEKAAPGSIVLLQAGAHNPTGVDPSFEQWKGLARLMQARQLFPFFDCAYQGFATGHLAQDNFAIRHFVEQGFELLVAQSFAKNMGLYGERVGALHYVAAPGPDAQDITARVASQLSIISRAELSSPPIYGAMIASIILNDAQLFAEWEQDLLTMSGRIKQMRASLREELERLQTPGLWDHITRQIGMFSFTGIQADEVVELRHKWHVYMAETGRISVAGLNTKNVRHVAAAFDDVVRRRVSGSISERS